MLYGKTRLNGYRHVSVSVVLIKELEPDKVAHTQNSNSWEGYKHEASELQANQGCLVSLHLKNKQKQSLGCAVQRVRPGSTAPRL